MSGTTVIGAWIEQELKLMFQKQYYMNYELALSDVLDILNRKTTWRLGLWHIFGRLKRAESRKHNKV